MSELKSMISRLGWSSWELKIDPKRVEEENEHVLESYMSQRRCQESFKRSPRWSLGSREAPKRPPRAPQRSPRASEEGLKSTQKAAHEPRQTLSEPRSNQKRRFLIIRRMSELKSMMLRVRESSWEPKFDPKRVEEENKHV